MPKAILLFALATAAFAQSNVQAVLDASQAAWNRGDLAAFASFYEDSPSTTFVGREVVHGGVAAILQRYQRGYPTPAAMGALQFSEISVRPLGSAYALATGKYQLTRTAEGGGNASGRFTLVLRRTPKGWRIIHDHSSSLVVAE
jgi:uncharacterized protein (TIGR02246 family)